MDIWFTQEYESGEIKFWSSEQDAINYWDRQAGLCPYPDKAYLNK